MKTPYETLDSQISFVVECLKDGNLGYAVAEELAKKYVEDEKGAHVVGLLFKEIIKLSRQNLAISCPFLHQNNKFRV